MESDKFSALSVPKKVWLVLNYACNAKLLGSALIKVVVLVLLGLACSIIGALTLDDPGTTGQHQIKFGSNEEKMLGAYVNMMGFESNKSYEFYAKEGRKSRLDSAWVPSRIVESWLEAGFPAGTQEMNKSRTEKDLDPSKAGYYQRVAGEWAQYKMQLKSAAGTEQECSLLRSIVAGLPWETPANQTGACQAGLNINAILKIMAGLLVLCSPVCLIVVARDIFKVKKPAWGMLCAILEYPANQKQAFNVWLTGEGDRSLSHLERYQFALCIWHPRMKKGSRLKKIGTKRL